MNPIKRAELESRILTELHKKKAATIGDQEVAVPNDSAFGMEITQYVMDLIDEFPPSPAGNKYIHAKCIGTPRLRVRLRDFKPLLSKDGDLLPHTIGKYIIVEPLRDKFFGEFTHEDIQLELIVDESEVAKLRKNEWTPEKARQESLTTSVNRVKHIGEVDVDPNLEKTEIVADIRFGNFEAKKQKIAAEKRDREPWELIISLQHLSLSGEIDPDGSVTLNNKATLCVDDLIGGEGVILLDALYTPKVNFDRREKGLH